MTALASPRADEVVVEPDAPARTGRRPVPWAPLVVLGTLAALAVWGRSLDLTSGFWQDEAKPVWAYVDRGPGEILFGDYDIDNHILYNLLTWAVTRVAGTAEVVYRLCSLVPAVASAVLLVAWTWRRIGHWAAVAVAALVALSPLHLDLAPQARAYGLTYLAFAGVLVAGDAFLRHGRRRDALLVGGAGFVGAASFPIFGLPVGLAALTLLAVVRRPGARRRLLVALVPWGVALAALTANAVPQLLSSAGDFRSHRELAPLGAGEIVLWPHRLVTPSLSWAAESVPALRAATWDASGWETVLSVALVYPLLALGVVWFARRVDWRLAALLVVPVVGTYALVVARGMALWPRYTSFLLYPAAVLVAGGLHALGTWLWPRPAARVAAVAGVALLLHPLLREPLGPTGAGIALGVLAVAGAAAVLLRRLGSRPLVAVLAAGALVAALPLATGFAEGAESFDEPLREDWKSMAADLPADPGLLAATSVHAGLVYYVGMPEFSLEGGNSRKRINRYDEVTFLSGKELTEVLCTTPGPITLVETAETSGRIDLGCLQGRDPRRSRYDMLLYGGHADLTVFPAAPGG